MEKRDIPVIYYNDEIGAWDAVDENSKSSAVAATYKNEMTEAERQVLLDGDGSGELHAYRSERRRAAFTDMNKKEKKRMPRGLPFFLMLGALFYFLWLYVQN